MRKILQITFGLTIFILSSDLVMAAQASDHDKYYGGTSRQIGSAVYECVRKAKSERRDPESCGDKFKKVCEREFINTGIRSNCKTQVNLSVLSASNSGFNLNRLKATKDSGEIELTLNAQGKKSIFNKIINFFISALGIVAVFMFCVGGLMMIISHGDENMIQQGKNIIIYTIGGVLVAMLSYIIVQFILGVLFF